MYLILEIHGPFSEPTQGLVKLTGLLYMSVIVQSPLLQWKTMKSHIANSIMNLLLYLSAKHFCLGLDKVG